MTRTRRFTINAAANYLRFAVTVVSMFCLTPYIIRHIGTTAFGVWSLIFSALGVFALFDCGFSTTIVKYVADCHADGDTDRRNRLVSSISVLYAVLSLLSALAIGGLSLAFDQLFSVAPVLKHAALEVLWILAFRMVILALPLGVYRDVLFGEQRIYAVNIVQIFSTLVYSVWTWIALAHHGTLVSMAWINLIAMLGEFGSYMALARHYIPGLHVSWRLASRESIRQELGFSMSQMVVNTASLVRLRTDPIIVKCFLSMDSVGVYTIALRIAESCLLLSKQITNIFAPVVAKMHREGDEAGIRKILTSGAKLAFAASLAISLPLCLLARAVVTDWVGPAFAGAAPVLVVLLIAMSLVILQMAACSVLTMSGHHKLTARADAIGIGINLAVSIALARPLGLVGVAVGTLVSTVVVDVLYVVGLSCRIYGIGYRSYIAQVVLPVAPACASLAGTVILLGRSMDLHRLHNVAGCALCGIVVYAAVFFLTGLNSDEHRSAGSILGRSTTRIAPGESAVGESA